MAEADKKMTHKLYLPQGYEKITPYMKQMKDAQSNWMPDSLFADFDPNCSHQGWVDIIKACDASSTKELSVWPSPDQTFGDNAPYKKTSIMPIENELSCECTVFEPIEESEEKKLMFLYVHGGGMAIFDGKGVLEWSSANYAMQGHIGVNVCFTNSVDECYPRGLNDVISAIKYFKTKYADKVKGICIHGESGGANLVVAALMKLKQEEPEKDYVDCIFVGCPYLYPFSGPLEEEFPTPADIKSSIEEFKEDNLANKIATRAFFLAYKGPEKDELEHLQDKFAWPYFAQEEDFKNFPPTYILSNEADVLNNVGLRFYRQLIGAGVQAYHSTEAGTFHGSEGMDMFYGKMVNARRKTFLNLALQAKEEQEQQAKAAAAEKVEEARKAA